MIFTKETLKTRESILQLENIKNAFISDLSKLIPESAQSISANLKFMSRYRTEEIHDFLQAIGSDFNYLHLILENNLPSVLDHYTLNHDLSDKHGFLSEFLKTITLQHYSTGQVLKEREVDNSRVIFEAVATPLLHRYINKRVDKILDLYKQIFPSLAGDIDKIITRQSFDIELNFIPQTKDDGSFFDSPRQKICNIWFGFSDKTDLDKSYGPMSVDYLYNRKSVIDFIIAHEILHILQSNSEIMLKNNTFEEASFREGMAVYLELILIKELDSGLLNTLDLNTKDFQAWKKQRLSSIYKEDKKQKNKYSDGTFKIHSILKNLGFSTKDLTLDKLIILYNEFKSDFKN